MVFRKNLNPINVTQKIVSTFRKNIWICLAILVLLVRGLFNYCPQCCETIYSRGIYLVFRWLLDHTFGLLPFPGLYIFILFILIYLVVKIKKYYLLIKTRQFNFLSLLHGLLSFVAALFFWFLILWGFNYARVPIEQQISLKTAKSLNYDEVVAEASFVKDAIINYRAQIPKVDSMALTSSSFPSALEDTMRQLLTGVLKELHYPYHAHVRGRYMYPKGSFLHFSTSGFYFPFTGDGNIDAGLPILTQPFTMAHELAHGYGFGDEATCNFLAYLACTASSDPAIQYAGNLTYYRYVFSELRRMNKEYYKKERATLPIGVISDLDTIYATIDRYPDFFPGVQQVAYDAYLKSQGVTEGVKSYNRMVVQVAAWRKQHGK